MRVYEIIAVCPQAADVMAAYGLHCFSCSIGGVESLQEGCSMHGFDGETVDALVEDINQTLRDQPLRPQQIEVTEAAAKAVEGIARAENRKEEGLAIVIDTNGGFCMEFRSTPDEGDQIFTEHGLKVFISPLTLWRIGGATIDFRDGRFKLDVPEDRPTRSCACNGQGCKCGA